MRETIGNSSTRSFGKTFKGGSVFRYFFNIILFHDTVTCQWNFAYLLKRLQHKFSRKVLVTDIH